MTREARDVQGSEFVPRFAALALGCVQREYPNHLAHLVADASQVKSPRELHPAFYGCYDWHSAVHGHWLLVHLLRTNAIPRSRTRRCRRTTSAQPSAPT